MASATYILLAVLCGSFFNASLANPTSRIVGGEEAIANAFPSVVSVRLDNSHTCGGNIVATDFILTAAHCVSELGTTSVASSRVTVRAGSTNPFAGGQIYNVESVHIHDSYGSFLNDLALLKLSSALVLGDKIKIIELADSDNEIDSGENVTIAGWGRTEASGQNAYKLQHGSSVVLSEDDCEESISYGYPSTLCLQSDPGQGTCNGDAGGPAIYNDVLYGVSSFVIGTCGTKYPDVFARVSYFNSWIKSIINDA